MSILRNTDTISNKTSRLLNMAGDVSKKSNLNYTHGCIITKNGKKVIEGYNHNRSYSKGFVCCSFHAELHAMKRWYSTFLRGKKIRCFLRPSPHNKKI
jgi:tRNA(Arg) A34 adenosine deaminase TadA